MPPETCYLRETAAKPQAPGQRPLSLTQNETLGSAQKTALGPASLAVADVIFVFRGCSGPFQQLPGPSDEMPAITPPRFCILTTATANLRLVSFLLKAVETLSLNLNSMPQTAHRADYVILQDMMLYHA